MHWPIYVDESSCCCLCLCRVLFLIIVENELYIYYCECFYNVVRWTKLMKRVRQTIWDNIQPFKMQRVKKMHMFNRTLMKQVLGKFILKSTTEIHIQLQWRNSYRCTYIQFTEENYEFFELQCASHPNWPWTTILSCLFDYILLRRLRLDGIKSVMRS